jgi:dTDP-4-dehydrorhamnose reductase
MISNPENILLTGGSGTLGRQIIETKIFENLLTPSREEVDLTKPESINKYLRNNNVDCVINSAALARMAACQETPIEAIMTNIIGTSNLVNSIIRMEERKQSTMRFIHISTDGVYSSINGNYSEKGPTIPYNRYGWSKLGAECSVNMLSNCVIVRTRFYNPDTIQFTDSADDIYTSSMPVNELIEAISYLVNSDYVGTINVGDVRMSEYDRYKKYKPLLKTCKRSDIEKKLNYAIASDASMDCGQWQRLKKIL